MATVIARAMWLVPTNPAPTQKMATSPSTKAAQMAPVWLDVFLLLLFM